MQWCVVIPAVEAEPEGGDSGEGMVGEVMEVGVCGGSGVVGDGDQVCALGTGEIDRQWLKRTTTTTVGVTSSSLHTTAALTIGGSFDVLCRHICPGCQ